MLALQVWNQTICRQFWMVFRSENKDFSKAN